jgi:superfamily II DNA or RNA helicase
MQLQASLFDRNEPAAKPAKTLRDYQRIAIAAIREKLAQCQTTLAVLATGMGKTVIAAHVAQEAAGRVLFLAHLDTLVSQSLTELQDMTGQPWEREQGDEKATRRGQRNVVASIQSLMRPDRYETFAQDAFSLVLVDEAHHYLAASFLKPIRYFMAGGARVVGFTATPDRKDGKAMGRLFLSAAVDPPMDIAFGVEEAWLSPIEWRPIDAHVSLDNVKVSKVTGDLDQGALDEEIARIIAPIVKVAVEKVGDRRCIVFTPGVKAAHAAAEALNRIRPGCARSIDGSMHPVLKRGIIREHKTGAFQYLVNCGVLVEGYDDAKVTCMIDAAPTKSRSRCAQKVGRITRLWPGIGDLATAEERRAGIAASPKPVAMWIDLVFNGSKHELASPVDLLGGSYTDKERASAKKILAKAGGGDPRAALDEARKRCAAAANRAQVRLNERGALDPLKRRSRSKVQAPDPNGAPSPGMLRAAEGFGVPVEGLTRAALQKLLSYEFLAKSKGWCNWAERDALMRNIGIDAHGMTREVATRVTRYWRAAGRPGRLTREQLAEAKGQPMAGWDG